MTEPFATLCIDAGNSALKVGIFQGEQLVAMESNFAYYFEKNTECLQLAKKAAADFPGIRCVIACGGSPGKQQYVSHFLAEVGELDHAIWLSAASPLPFSMNYTEGKPGADRIANIFALRKLAPGVPSAVIDFGTSTHIESADADGDFAGGLIMIGISESRRALGQATGGVLALPPRFDETPEEQKEIFAFSTYDAVTNGLLLQQRAPIDQFLKEAMKRAPETRFFATGGHAEEIVPLLGGNVQLVQELTLMGLREFAEYFFQAKANNA